MTKHLRVDAYWWGQRACYDPWKALAAAIVRRAYIDATQPRTLYLREPVANLQEEAKQFLKEWMGGDEARRG